MKWKTSSQLSRPLTLQQRTPGTNAEGAPQDTWATVGTVWASVSPLSTRELLMAAQAGIQLTHLVTIPYRTDVDHNSRFLEGSRVLDVVSAPLDLEERHINLQIMCRELQVL